MCSFWSRMIQQNSNSKKTIAPSLLKDTRLKVSTSHFISFGVNGSMAVEGSLVAALFLLLLLSLIYSMEMIRIQGDMMWGLHQVGNKMIFTCEEMESQSVKTMLEDYTDITEHRNLKNLSFDGSEIMKENDRVILLVKYDLKGLISWPLADEFPIRQKYFGHAWTGYDLSHGQNDQDVNMVVYITRTGSVYHREHRCAYLQPSVRYIEKSEIKEARNEKGGIYSACAACAALPEMYYYYVTDYGTKYHGSLNCSSLKRTVYAVLLQEAQEEGKGPCSKCG